MYAPRPRPTSRSSTLTILDSSPPSSWSGRMQPSSRTSTSIWSDDGTEMPHDKDSVTVVGGVDEEPLIDFGDEDGGIGGTEPTPGDKLRMLLSQMDAEIRQVTPVIPRTITPIQNLEVEVGRGGWRDGRRRGFEKVERSPSPSPPASPERDEEESPPTPPPRTTRAFLNPGRRVSGEGTSRSPTVTSQPEPQHKPSPLETFIATHPAPPITPTSDPSSSRSFDRSSTSRNSRKGKERAAEPPTRTPRPSRYAPVHSSTDLSDHATRKRYPVTPRRVSIELAPDDSELFAEGAEELEVRGEVELDLDEASGEPPPWGETEESEQAGEAVDRTERERVRAPVQKQLWKQSRENSLQSDRSAEASLPQSGSRETSFRPLEASLSQDSSRLSRILAESRPPHEPPSLPALPEPDLSQSADDEDNVDTLSSRRAALFRSTSRSSPRQSQSPSLASIRRNQVLETPLQEPIRVGMALVSTPSPSTPKMGNATSTLTPHPPGRWQSSPASVKGNVRFSPLRPPGSTDADRSFGSAHSGDRSIHRLKLSPAKVRSPAKSKSEPAEGDTSFIRRLSRAVTRRPIPQPSTTLSEAQSALARAAEASSIAQIKVERTQRQWLEALASVQNNVAVDVIRKSWGWGTWVWWVGVELLLLWGVFRVTLDFATSTHYLSSLDPFAPTNLALSIPLPTAISEFVLPHRSSANFFDLIERAEVWRRLEGVGFGVQRVGMDGMRIGMDGVRMMGGVPT